MERKAAAERLINFDKEISVLMSNKLPESFASSPNMDINEALAQAFNDASGYNSGLKLSYAENILNVTSSDSSVVCSVLPGTRAPDVELLKPGTKEPVRLQRLTPNLGRFYVVVFAGNPRVTLPQLALISEFIISPDSFTRCFPPQALSVLTIGAGRLDFGISDALGIKPFSPTYFDEKRKAHIRYGVDVKLGAMEVLRPDGFVGSSVPLTPDGGGQVFKYLSKVLKEDEPSRSPPHSLKSRL